MIDSHGSGIASLSSGRRMAKAEVLEVLGRRPFEARTGLQAAGASSFVFEVRTGEVQNTDTQFTIFFVQGKA